MRIRIEDKNNFESNNTHIRGSVVKYNSSYYLIALVMNNTILVNIRDGRIWSDSSTYGSRGIDEFELVTNCYMGFDED